MFLKKEKKEEKEFNKPAPKRVVVVGSIEDFTGFVTSGEVKGISVVTRWGMWFLEGKGEGLLVDLGQPITGPIRYQEKKANIIAVALQRQADTIHNRSW